MSSVSLFPSFSHSISILMELHIFYMGPRHKQPVSGVLTRSIEDLKRRVLYSCTTLRCVHYLPRGWLQKHGRPYLLRGLLVPGPCRAVALCECEECEATLQLCSRILSLCLLLLSSATYRPSPSGPNQSSPPVPVHVIVLKITSTVHTFSLQLKLSKY